MEVDDLLKKIDEHLAVGSAFGPPQEQDGTLLIPVALVAGGGGGGIDNSSGEKGGSGFGGVVYPLGAYVVRGGQVKFVPTFDATLAIAGAMFLLRVIAKGWRRRAVSRGTRG
jgi:uncharacterized spore protein YtfJ